MNLANILLKHFSNVFGAATLMSAVLVLFICSQ